MENKYRVECRTNSNDYFRKDCSEKYLEETKKIVKLIQKEEGKGECFYRKFPVMKNKRIYF